MDKVTLALEAEGKADIDTHFKFVPLDVAGHILCPLEWTADKRITASIPPQSVATAMSLVRKDASADLSYDGKLDTLALKLHFQPSPLSLVLQNVNFALACPSRCRTDQRADPRPWPAAAGIPQGLHVQDETGIVFVFADTADPDRPRPENKTCPFRELRGVRADRQPSRGSSPVDASIFITRSCRSFALLIDES